MEEEAEMIARDDKMKLLIAIENLKCPSIGGLFTELVIDNYISIKKRSCQANELALMRPRIIGFQSHGYEVVVKVNFI